MLRFPFRFVDFSWFSSVCRAFLCSFVLFRLPIIARPVRSSNISVDVKAIERRPLSSLLRNIGELSLDKQQRFEKASRSEISKRLIDKQKEKLATAHQVLDDKGEPLDVPGNTHGNLYTTTLHVINSAVLKLGNGMSDEAAAVHVSKKQKA